MADFACPHENVVHCPLYFAAHLASAQVAPGLSCDDGKLDRGTCAVARGMDYATAVGRLLVHAPRLVAHCRWREEAAARSRQIALNLRVNGIH